MAYLVSIWREGVATLLSVVPTLKQMRACSCRLARVGSLTRTVHTGEFAFEGDPDSDLAYSFVLVTVVGLIHHMILKQYQFIFLYYVSYSGCIQDPLY